MTDDTVDPFDTVSPFEDDEGVKRDRYGRYLVIPPGGKGYTGYTRATTFVKTIADTYNLQKWEKRMVATGLSLRPDLMLAVSTSREDKKRLDQICDEAKEAAAASAKATIGTALHKLTEKVDRGEDIGIIPDAYGADLGAYVKTTDPLDVLEIERVVVNDELKVGGRLDRIVHYQGRNLIADVKTGDIEWGSTEIAMQLAIYAHSALYDQAANKRIPLPDVDIEDAIVIHLPAGTGTCQLHWVNIRAGWEAVQLAANVRAWRKHKGLIRPFAPEAATPETQLSEWIETAHNVADLEALWAAHRTVWTAEHTQLAAARKALLQGGLVA